MSGNPSSFDCCIKLLYAVVDQDHSVVVHDDNNLQLGGRQVDAARPSVFFMRLQVGRVGLAAGRTDGFHQSFLQTCGRLAASSHRLHCSVGAAERQLPGKHRTDGLCRLLVSSQAPTRSPRIIDLEVGVHGRIRKAGAAYTGRPSLLARTMAMLPGFSAPESNNSSIPVSVQPGTVGWDPCVCSSGSWWSSVEPTPWCWDQKKTVVRLVDSAKRWLLRDCTIGERTAAFKAVSGTTSCKLPWLRIAESCGPD